MTTKSNWTGAETACTNDGAQLVSIHSYEENLFIAKMTEIGVSSRRFPWLGGHYDPSLKWSDGQAACYHNFTSSSGMDYVSQNVSGDPQCLYMNSMNILGRWGKTSCSMNRSYICKKGIFLSVTPEITFHL